MRLLLDTHALFWFFEGNPRLSSSAREAIADDESAVHVSAVSAIEIAQKYRAGKLPAAAELAVNFEALMIDYDFAPLPITLRHAQVAGLLQIPHKDPFDRLLIAQAQTEALVLVSNEVTFDSFGVIRLW